MNKNIQQLHTIANKPERLIVGLMSGTSLDGLDIALCSIKDSGLQTKLQLLHFETIPYNDFFKKEIKSIFSKKNVDLEKLTLLHSWIGIKHGEMVLKCLQKWNVDKNSIDVIASHGQTIFHAPKRFHNYLEYGNATLQIGDGDHIAATTGIITISDFRQKHIAAGGEGAPLALYGDYILFSKKNQDRILLNIGGIANFTYLPGSLNVNEIICTDVGPGNTLMDVYIQQFIPEKYFDENAAIASQGKVNEFLLKELKNNKFFSQPFPKTTGPELFSFEYIAAAQNNSLAQNLSMEDVVATLNKFSADIIIAAINNLETAENTEVYISGGGAHNSLLIQHLKRGLQSFDFNTTESLGIHPDAKEAVLFAILANECIAGSSQVFSNNQQSIPAVNMGKISFPL